jgi:hypothetical protein
MCANSSKSLGKLCTLVTDPAQKCAHFSTTLNFFSHTCRIPLLKSARFATSTLGAHCAL